MTTLTRLIERHEELSREVQRLTEMDNLTPNEQKNLTNLKKLKLSYKDAILQANRIDKMTYDDQLLI